jgi:hypothetical protein
MTAFHECSARENEATDKIFKAMDSTFSRLDLKVERIVGRKDQKTLGDVRLTSPNGKIKTADIKAETRASHNIFFETYSNFIYGDMLNPGWGMTLKADSLWYWFAEADAMAVLDLSCLRKWLWVVEPNGKHRFNRYQETEQTRHSQDNITMGRLIPFKDMPLEVFSRGYLLQSDTSSECTPGEFTRHIAAVIKSRNQSPRS